MISQAIITIRFLDWWLGGTGETEAGGADKNAYRDEWNCPALPASQVKGTLRETAELWAGWEEGQINSYFGSRTELATSDERDESTEGQLEWGAEACLPNPTRDYLFAHPNIRKELFGQISQTAINQETGVAEHRSLRQIEAVVPMDLVLNVYWTGDENPDWAAQLDKLCALTPAFGALKQDGFGRAISDCQKVEKV